MLKPGTGLTPSELAEIRARWAVAQHWLRTTTYGYRVGQYGPEAAQAVLRSCNDIPRLLEALDG